MARRDLQCGALRARTLGDVLDLLEHGVRTAEVLGPPAGDQRSGQPAQVRARSSDSGLCHRRAAIFARRVLQTRQRELGRQIEPINMPTNKTTMAMRRPKRMGRC